MEGDHHRQERPNGKAAVTGCGRFAPSPTGPLHFGSLVAALGSWLQARSQAQTWCLRIEDVDITRTRPGADAAIRRALEALCLVWDGPVMVQSQRTAVYAAALERLRDAGWAYPCACTRQAVAAVAQTGLDGPVYPGTCRAGLPAGSAARAWRVRVSAGATTFDDAVFGRQQQTLAEAVGDFVVRRADGLFAYQLAVVLDDAEAGVTEVVRGADLLDSTPRQIWLQQLLGLPVPRYAHLPLAVDAAGVKWSKQTGAPALDLQRPGAELARALEFLGHPPPAGLQSAPPDEVLTWALPVWSLARVPKVRYLPAG